MWIVYEEHSEYFETSILAVKSTREEAIEDIVNRIEERYSGDLAYYQTSFIGSMTMAEGKITTKCGLKAQFVEN